MKKSIYLLGGSEHLKILGNTLRGNFFQVEIFKQPRECILALQCAPCPMLLIDFISFGAELLCQMGDFTRACPGLAIIGLVPENDADLAVKALKSGVREVLTQTTPPRTMIQVLGQLMENKRSLSDFKLTKPQQQVMQMILQGKTNQEIAGILKRSIRTVEDHRYNLMRKLGVNRLVDMVRLAVENGWIQDSGPRTQPRPYLAGSRSE